MRILLHTMVCQEEFDSRNAFEEFVQIPENTKAVQEPPAVLVRLSFIPSLYGRTFWNYVNRRFLNEVVK